MPVASDARLLVLHGLRLGGFVGPEQLVARSGVAADGVERELVAAADAGWARAREGRVSGWALTAEGRAESAALVAAEIDAAGCRGAVADAYQRFLTVNPELLAACTAWQVRDESSQQLNDHTDAAYDAGVVERLGAVDARVQPVCADLARELGRFGGYGPRLSAALDRVRAGEVEWFARPLIDSYHTVWFELHEDLLVTLAIERSSEATSQAVAR